MPVYQDSFMDVDAFDYPGNAGYRRGLLIIAGTPDMHQKMGRLLMSSVTQYNI